MRNGLCQLLNLKLAQCPYTSPLDAQDPVDTVPPPVAGGQFPGLEKWWWHLTSKARLLAAHWMRRLCRSGRTDGQTCTMWNSWAVRSQHLASSSETPAFSIHGEVARGISTTQVPCRNFGRVENDVLNGGFGARPACASCRARFSRPYGPHATRQPKMKTPRRRQYMVICISAALASSSALNLAGQVWDAGLERWIRSSCIFVHSKDDHVSQGGQEVSPTISKYKESSVLTVNIACARAPAVDRHSSREEVDTVRQI